ncbi:MAG TPA: GatB/YqeY domain-containing protein [Candidatus Saccharimonadales bacterium]|nr:GatB/YqeY domain-containing protein [Candidatus Saccharimonadales bacterium]
MTLEERIERDLKAALLQGDKPRVETLRGLKSAILYAKVAAGTREQAMPDEQVTALLAKEAKKRQESVDLYLKGDDQARADKELAEKAIIREYLPQQLDEAEIKRIVDAVIAVGDYQDMSAMGKVIAEVKQKTAGAADGATVARIVKESLGK